LQLENTELQIFFMKRNNYFHEKKYFSS